MRAAIHNPYLDTLGGGERYTLSFVKVLMEKGYRVDLEWKNTEIIKQLENRFGLSLKGLNVAPDVKRGNGYDLCFWVSDGSVPSLLSRKNILHFQVPFHNVNGKSLINKMKLFRVNKIVCNSRFTKQTIDKEYGVESTVIYPAIDTLMVKPKRKENIILSVGRFSGLLQSKHQDILIRAFRKLVDNGLRDWKLVLVGGADVGDDGFSDQLAQMADGYPIEIIKNLGFKSIKDLYGNAKLFWSASGFGVDENINPERVEHFGITIVEAMAAGAVPIVFDAGGHKEIVQNGQNGFLWNTENDLLKITKDLIDNKSQLKKISISGTISSKNYSNAKFEANFIKIL